MKLGFVYIGPIPKEGENLIENHRIADNSIYLNENRSKEPKQIFKYMGQILSFGLKPSYQTLLDVGCATGDFIDFLNHEFPHLRTSGLDVSEPMIKEAQSRIPNSKFVVQSLLEADYFDKNQFDVVVSCGVVTIFDDIAVPLTHILKSMKPGGLALICSLINPEPVDVLMRYRRANTEGDNAPWESGWNVFSEMTHEKVMRKYQETSGQKLEWKFYPFRMPMAIPKRPDPMRSWTIRTDDDPFQTINGANQILNHQVLQIRKT
jgi:ubiquinone/menaquinone biosynthesis C-methylase UbiE